MRERLLALRSVHWHLTLRQTLTEPVGIGFRAFVWRPPLTGSSLYDAPPRGRALVLNVDILLGFWDLQFGYHTP